MNDPVPLLDWAIVASGWLAVFALLLAANTSDMSRRTRGGMVLVAVLITAGLMTGCTTVTVTDSSVWLCTGDVELVR